MKRHGLRWMGVATRATLFFPIPHLWDVDFIGYDVVVCDVYTGHFFCLGPRVLRFDLSYI